MDRSDSNLVANDLYPHMFGVARREQLRFVGLRVCDVLGILPIRIRQPYYKCSNGDERWMEVCAYD